MTLAKEAAEEEPQGERRRLRVPTSVAVEEEKPPGERRRLRVSTSVAATLLVAILSILVGPAFARQWDDRQKARDLKAAIADQIATATARTVVTGIDAARAQGTEARRHYVSRARAFWRPASLRIEMRLRAYFPASMATEWERLVLEIDDFLVNVCAKASPPGRAIQSDLTDNDRRANIAGWFESFSRSQPLPESLAGQSFRAIALIATSVNAEGRALVVEAGGELMFAKADKMTAVLFDAHPVGFSTSRRDLLLDLLP
jgi:hypothetical protein